MAKWPAGLVLLGALIASPADATTLVYTNRAAFLSDTGATSATGPYPDLGTATPQPATVGSITFSSPSPSTVVIGVAGHGILDWTALLPGHDIAINDVENLDLVASAPVFAMGFDFVEPSRGGSTTDTCFVAVCTDSTFAVALKNGASVVDSFTFNAPDDVAAFVGAWSSAAFDRMEIRETVGGIDDEYWGQVYTGSRPLVAASERPGIALIALGVGALVAARARRNKFKGGQAASP